MTEVQDRQAPDHEEFHDPAAVNGPIEEIFSSLTHAIGVGLSIAGLIVLLVLTRAAPSPWKYVSFSIYGASQILLYLSSALVHSFASIPRARYYLRIIDQAFVYLLIAGTYTPVVLITMRGNYGWVVFGVEWGLAILGIVLKTTVFKKKHLITDLLYLPMGWVIFVTIRQVIESVPRGLLLWVAVGGALYTGGMVFYLWKGLRGSHVVWHLFVLGGSISFFLGFALHLAPL